MIVVGNKNIQEHLEDTWWVYVARPSVLGNIYSHKPSKFSDTIMVANVEEAIAKYREWLWNKIKTKDVAVLNELSRIKQVAENENVTLLCWCVNENRDGACHAHVIKAALEWMMK